MNNYNKLSAIEIHNLILKSKEKHELLKNEIFSILDDIKQKENKVNIILKEIDTIENNYVVLMENLLNKQSK